MDLGKYCNKDSKLCSLLEMSQLIHTCVYGKHRRCTLDELIEYKIIINNLKKKYGQNEDIFLSDNINIRGISGLPFTCTVFNKSFIINKVILGFFQVIFDIYMEHYLGYTLYYDNLTHYKYYSKITNENKPIYMFIHGLGIGLLQYFPLINNFDGYNLIYVDVPNISLRKEFDYMDDRIIYISFFIILDKIK